MYVYSRKSQLGQPIHSCRCVEQMDENGEAKAPVGKAVIGSFDAIDNIESHCGDIQSINKRRRRATPTPTTCTASTSEVTSNITTINDCDDYNHHLKATDLNASIPTNSSIIDVENDTKIQHEQDDLHEELIPQPLASVPTVLYQPNNRKMKKKNMDPKILQFRTMIQNCCKTNDLYTAIRAYNDAIPNQIRIEAQTFYNLLHLCSNDNSNNSNGNTGTVNTDETSHDISKDHPTSTTLPKTMKIHVGTPKEIGRAHV